jgi:hypothetical protein
MPRTDARCGVPTHEAPTRRYILECSPEIPADERLFDRQRVADVVNGEV